MSSCESSALCGAFWTFEGVRGKSRNIGERIKISYLLVGLRLLRVVAEPTHGISSRNQVVMKE